MSSNKATRPDTSGPRRDCAALSRRPEILDLHCLGAVARKHRNIPLEMIPNKTVTRIFKGREGGGYGFLEPVYMLDMYASWLDNQR